MQRDGFAGLLTQVFHSRLTRHRRHGRHSLKFLRIEPDKLAKLAHVQREGTFFFRDSNLTHPTATGGTRPADDALPFLGLLPAVVHKFARHGLSQKRQAYGATAARAADPEDAELVLRANQSAMAIWADEHGIFSG
jgi:hypothetical protein